MNRMAYLATGSMIAICERFSKLRVHIHGAEQVPKGGGVIFVVNHFTRIETLLLPYHIYLLTGQPVWSLADASFFDGALSGVLDLVGAISTRSPDRDRVIVKTLLTREANWIIFPEGRMVKDKGVFRRRLFLPARGSRPHSGAATVALRTEFYRQRLMSLAGRAPQEVERLKGMFGISDLEPVLKGNCWIVPVNITYYPLRARENVLSMLGDLFLKNASPRLREEMLTEGNMLFAGVDIDIRFGPPLDPSAQLLAPAIQADIDSALGTGFDDLLPSLPDLRREARRLMDGYMSSIYQLTTVNHDHLFASLLRASPLKTVSESDLRRRVYLLASDFLRSREVHCHHSLQHGQVALLTDDRYHKYRDFLLLAIEKGVVSRRDGKLIKDRGKFSAPFEMQRARIDNPVGVIANEVLPLTPLQRQVHLMAWLPGAVVRRRVAADLERQAREEFDEDYRVFYRDGESKEKRIGAPVLLHGRSRKLGVVLVHGFLSAPAEVAELALYLNGKGYWVYQVRLKGHGTSPDDLALRRGGDWVESVDLGYALLSAACERVVLGGFSFGGGVALECASRVADAAGVFAVCPPHRLLDISSRFAPAITVWNRVMDVVSYQWAKKEFVETVPERPQINYARLPVAGVRELGRFMKDLEPKLGRIEAPVLVLQSEGDPVVDPKGSERLFEMLGSEDKEYLKFPLKRHGILAGAGSEEVHAAIGAFVDRITAGDAVK
ncbi:alpha/beta fold hydrolase [Geomonas sp.]|uniref:alpha/beta fold hydrolase n=1 Tax=Geomonas sp. TaxID=2651584 RepID=UPI002B48CC83|nr:alpha/beta fold hydrolase [Geomonas sp.]HJV34939.1 alpha/beta fold hydrolase [Geomonas sp.]